MRVRPLLLLLVGLAIAACGPEAPPRASRAPEPPTPDTRPLIESGSGPLLSEMIPDPRALGNPAAPITLVEYGDYQCPYCSIFFRETKSLIEEQYVKTGKVYFVYRDLPLSTIHPGALLASHFANCAAAQGSFWPMHNRLFEGAAANEWGDGDEGDFQTFSGYASALGLDVAAIERCVRSKAQARQIEADVREATQLGINSTPTFLVNGQPVLGAYSFRHWKQAFDRILAQ